ncbi:Riboflavin biosynthesis protein RibD [Phycisphaerae bacterium RAS1]|nr:Riboflavin biosynthesis protein RibD [Phycisphaerae bacterium RAS1]
MKPPPDSDAAFMGRALTLARRGLGRVEPNPMVGCVIVRHGRIIAEGWHRRFGGPHAEVEALRACHENPRGATAYVTLEPCCYFGKTPPCTDALLAAGIRRVVAAAKDPNPRVAGRGLRILRKAGVEVRLGVLESEAVALNAPFFKLLKTGRPWVILKWGQSLDGRIATRSGDSKWITDAAMRSHAHRVRGRLDAIIVGVGTVLTDDPLLTCRVGPVLRTATRVMLDSRLRTPPSAQVVRTAGRVSTWIFCGGSAPARRRSRLEKAGCRVTPVRSKRGGLSLPAVLDALGQAAMTNVLVEGGGKLLGEFVDQRLADEFHVYVAPRLIGGAKACGALSARGPQRVSESLSLRFIERPRAIGDGWFFRAAPLHAAAAERKRAAAEYRNL